MLRLPVPNGASQGTFHQGGAAGFKIIKKDFKTSLKPLQLTTGKVKFNGVIACFPAFIQFYLHLY